MTESRVHQIIFAMLGVALIIVVIAMLRWHWGLVHLSEETGTSSSSSRAYNFWSGFGSDIGEIAIVGGLITLVRHHNCHVKGCWAMGRQVPGTPYVACHDHNPERADNSKKRNVSADEIQQHYEQSVTVTESPGT